MSMRCVLPCVAGVSRARDPAPLRPGAGVPTMPGLLSHSPVADAVMTPVPGKIHRGLTLFARIDHAAGASTVGKQLRPTQVLIFGSAQAGTPFGEAVQIDQEERTAVFQCAQGDLSPLEQIAFADADKRGRDFLVVSRGGHVSLAERGLV